MKPKPNGPNDGRGEDGRFLPGNPGRPGQSHMLVRVAVTQKFNSLKLLQPEDIEEIIKAQIAQAKQGDTVAAKFILERVLGRPQVIDLALVAMKARIEGMRVESDEKQQKELYTLLDLIP